MAEAYSSSTVRLQSTNIDGRSMAAAGLALSAFFSLEAALLAFAGSGLYKSLPGFRAFPLDWTLFTGLIVAGLSVWELLRMRARVELDVLLALLAVMTWLTYSAAGFLWSSGGETAYSRLTTGIPLVILTYLAATVVATDARRVERLLMLVPFLGLLALFSTVQVATRGSYQEAQELAAANYIMRGIAMSLGAMALLARILSGGSSRKATLAYLSMFAVFGIGIVIAGSRQALGAFAFGSLVATFRAVRLGLWRPTLAVYAAGTAVCGVSLLLLGRAGISLTTIDRLLLLVSTASGGSSFNERSAFVATAVNGFLESPWVGHGFASFGTYHGNNPTVYPHNLLLEVGFEGGLVGIALLTAAVMLTALASKRLAALRPSTVNHFIVLGACVVSLNMMVSGTYAESRLMYVILGIALAMPSGRSIGEVA